MRSRRDQKGVLHVTLLTLRRQRCRERLVPLMPSFAQPDVELSPDGQQRSVGQLALALRQDFRRSHSDLPIGDAHFLSPSLRHQRSS